MGRFFRKVSSEVARQALVNKTVSARMLEEAATGPEPSVDEGELQLLAGDITAPELLPYEYAYVDLYTDGRGNFYLHLLNKFHRRSRVKNLTSGEA